ncbi:MAG: glycosyltransferase [Candidatus Kapaibacterium sp.]
MEQNNEERNEQANTGNEHSGETRQRNHHRRDKYRGNRRPHHRGNGNERAQTESDANASAENTQETPQRPPQRERNRPSEQRNEPRGERGPSSISVVIPMLNEEESLPELIDQLEKVLEKASRGRYEVLFIDDGSTDSSFDIVRRYNRKNSRIHGIRFRRNYGKSAALSVAFAAAKNDVVITMDADLQDDPNEIPNLLAKIQEGFDLVSGWKKKRNDPLEKRLPSKFFNFVTSTVSGIKLHDFNCGLKAYRKDVVKTVQVYGEMHRYIPALAHWEGFKVTEIPVQHHARKYGYSKFGFSRYMKGFLDLLTVVFTTRFIKRPLHLFGTLGAFFAIVGFSVDLYLSYEWAFNNVPLSNRPLTLAGVALIIVGVQLISMGLIGEMIVKNSLSNAEYTVKEKF